MDPKELKEFADEGLFQFADKTGRMIDEVNIEKIRVAAALKKDLGVNAAGIEVILGMREKMLRMRMDMNTLLVQIRNKLGNRLSENIKKFKTEAD